MEELSNNSKLEEDLLEGEAKSEVESDIKEESSPPSTRKKAKNRGNSNPGIQECIECGEEFAKIQALMAHSVQTHGGGSRYEHKCSENHREQPKAHARR